MTDMSNETDTGVRRLFKYRWIAILAVNVLVIVLLSVFVVRRTGPLPSHYLSPEATQGEAARPSVQGQPAPDASRGAWLPGYPGMPETGTNGGAGPESGAAGVSRLGSGAGGFPKALERGGGSPVVPATAGGVLGPTIQLMNALPVPGEDDLAVGQLIFWLRVLVTSRPWTLEPDTSRKLRAALEQWRASQLIVCNGELAITRTLSDAQKEELFSSHFFVTTSVTLNDVKAMVRQTLETLEQKTGPVGETGGPVSSESYQPRPWRMALPLNKLAIGCTDLARKDGLSGEQMQKLRSLFRQTLEALEAAQSAGEALAKVLGPAGLEEIRKLKASSGFPPVVEPGKVWEPFSLWVLNATINALE